jgi:hypothetical protein
MSAVRDCGVLREDGDPLYDRQSPWFHPSPALWAPGCGHVSCTQQPVPLSGWHEWDDPIAECRYALLHQCCYLDEGHDGRHEYEPLPDPIHGYAAVAP